MIAVVDVHASKRASIALRCAPDPGAIAEARRAEADRLRAIVGPPFDESRGDVERHARPRRYGRLPRALVSQIRAARAAGESYRTIAERFDVSEGVIGRALRAHVAV